MKQLFIFIFSISFFSHFSVSAEKANLPVLLSSPEDKELNINEIKKNKVLIFISRTCPCTQQNIPYIMELSKEFPAIDFIGIHSVKNTTQKDIDDIISQHHLRFPIINDKNLLIANILKANRTPQAIILNENNVLLYSGGITNRTNPKSADKLYLKNALTEIINNKEVSKKETRSLGCVILR